MSHRDNARSPRRHAEENTHIEEMAETLVVDVVYAATGNEVCSSVVPLTATAQFLKSAITLIAAIDEQQQRLLFEDEPLDDNEMLRDLHYPGE